MQEQQDETSSLPQLWTVAQVGKALNLGKSKVYQLIWREHLPVQRFGRAIRVSPTELQRWLTVREKA